MASIQAAAIREEQLMADLHKVVAKLAPNVPDRMSEWPTHNIDPKLLMGDRIEWTIRFLGQIQRDLDKAGKTDKNDLVAEIGRLEKELEAAQAENDSSDAEVARLQGEVERLTVQVQELKDARTSRAVAAKLDAEEAEAPEFEEQPDGDGDVEVFCQVCSKSVGFVTEGGHTEWYCEEHGLNGEISTEPAAAPDATQEPDTASEDAKGSNARKKK